MIDQWWTLVAGGQLAQGDLLPNCLVPVFSGVPGDGAEAVEEELDRARLIVLTQSCDLENDKVAYVALCSIDRLDEFESVDESFPRTGAARCACCGSRAPAAKPR